MFEDDAIRVHLWMLQKKKNQNIVKCSFLTEDTKDVLLMMNQFLFGSFVSSFCMNLLSEFNYLMWRSKSYSGRSLSLESENQALSLPIHLGSVR